MTSARSHFVGVMIALGIAGAAHVVHGCLGSPWDQSLGEVSIALLLGLLFGNLSPGLESYRLGFKFCLDWLLKIAIVLLGLRITLGEVLAFGGVAVLGVAFTMSFALALALMLGRWFGVESRLASLIGIGVSVCGNTAISAAAPAIGATEQETSFAIATNTIFGTIAVFLYPVLAQAWEVSDLFFGFWSGLAVNDTSQVVASSFSYSSAAGEIATTVKLTRNSLMGFAIVFVTWLHARKDPSIRSTGARLTIPGFVVAFLVLAILHSSGATQWILGDALVEVELWAKQITGWLVLVALTAVGLNTRLSGMRQIGLAPLGLGFLVASLTSLAVVALLSLTPFLGWLSR